jgi:hypothetical protein
MNRKQIPFSYYCDNGRIWNQFNAKSRIGKGRREPCNYTGITETSKHLAVKEDAVKSHAQILKDYDNLNPPLDNSAALLIRRKFLLSKLHIKRQQKISGYIAFITFK